MAFIRSFFLRNPQLVCCPDLILICNLYVYTIQYITQISLVKFPKIRFLKGGCSSITRVTFDQFGWSIFLYNKLWISSLSGGYRKSYLMTSSPYIPTLVSRWLGGMVFSISDYLGYSCSSIWVRDLYSSDKGRPKRA